MFPIQKKKNTAQNKIEVVISSFLFFLIQFKQRNEKKDKQILTRQNNWIEETSSIFFLQHANVFLIVEDESRQINIDKFWFRYRCTFTIKVYWNCLVFIYEIYFFFVSTRGKRGNNNPFEYYILCAVGMCFECTVQHQFNRRYT